MSTIDYSQIFNKGFIIWLKNLKICIPHILNILTTLTLGILLISTLLLFTEPFLLTIILDSPTTIFNPYTIQQISSYLQTYPLQIFTTLLITYFLLNIINSFYLAGAIGMNTEALNNHKTKTIHMLQYGRKHLTPLFIFNTINGVLIIPFFILTLQLLPQSKLTFLSPSYSILSLGIYLFLYLIIQFFIHLTPYAIITDQSTTLQAIKKTKSLIWHNKINTLLILIIIPLISSLITLPFFILIYLTTQTWQLFYIIPYCITLPLGTLWLTQYYQQLIKK